jgi:signal transduction histidine kinase
VAEEEGMALDTQVTGGIRLRGNRELLGQALMNLVENAIKYAKPPQSDGRITVGVRQHEGRVLIEVSDKGPGIPEADRQRVLERFVRLDAEPSAVYGR